jgi:hypothetical protein
LETAAVFVIIYNIFNKQSSCMLLTNNVIILRELRGWAGDVTTCLIQCHEFFGAHFIKSRCHWRSDKSQFLFYKALSTAIDILFSWQQPQEVKFPTSMLSFFTSSQNWGSLSATCLSRNRQSMCIWVALIRKSLVRRRC